MWYLVCVWIARSMCVSAFGVWKSGTHSYRAHFSHGFCVFLVDPMSIVHRSPRTEKRRFLDKFGSHSTIHTFKNYFVTVFSVISFQFSTNKRYPNRPFNFKFLIWWQKILLVKLKLISAKIFRRLDYRT